VSNTADGITDMGEFVFRDSLSEAQVIPQTIAQAKEQLGLERVAVLYGDDDAFTQSGADVFLDVLEQEGIEVTTTQTFAKGDTDFSAQLTEARNTEPDALVVSALAEEGSLILTQARDLGLDVPVIGGNGFNSPAIAANAGEAAEGLIVGAAWNSASDVPANQEFLANYEEAFGEAPDQFAAQAYAGMNILDAAVRSACSSDPAEIRDALAEVSGLDTVLGEFSFTEDRNADHEAVVQVIEGGEFAILE
jgi:branched-chain amino acid transport system substrate-binding protein